MQRQVQRNAGTAAGARSNIHTPFLAGYLVTQAAQSEMLAVAYRAHANAVVIDLNMQGMVMAPHTQPYV
jgi:PPE-repeat protein